MLRTAAIARSGALTVAVALLVACSSAAPGPDASADVDAWAGFPAVEGPEPSREVAAFYYAWYGTPENDGRWIHWDQNGHTPPSDIGSDFYPALGAYSSSDPAVVAQHMAWLRRAGIGVIVLSYWKGETTREVIDLVFDTAAHYGIQVAFHIEPYASRSRATLATDVADLLDDYGAHPAFYRLGSESLWLPGVRARPVFFVFISGLENAAAIASGQPCDDPSTWAPALDEIHERSDAFMLSAPCGGRYVDAVLGAHFDGGYNYLDFDLSRFSWMATMPRGSLVVPSVIPGTSQVAIGLPEVAYDREAGAYFRRQLATILSQGVRPQLLTVTSFNEWHEGTQIEPAAAGSPSGDTSRARLDYGALPEDGYLTLTNELVAEYLANDWSAVAVTPLRVTLETTSDWTWLEPVAGAFLQPGLVAGSPELTGSGWSGQRLLISQDLARAESGASVSVTYELGAIDLGDGLTLEVGRGGIGVTEVTVEVLIDGSYEVVGTYRWAGTSDDQNRSRFTVPAARLV